MLSGVYLSQIQEARERIAGTIVHMPLIRLEVGPEFPDIRFELENLFARLSLRT